MVRSLIVDWPNLAVPIGAEPPLQFASLDKLAIDRVCEPGRTLGVKRSRADQTYDRAQRTTAQAKLTSRRQDPPPHSSV